MSVFASLVVVLLASSGKAEQAQAVFRDPVVEITMPPGVPLPTATKAADASGADYSSETARGVYRIQYADLPSSDVEKLFSSILGSIRENFSLQSSDRSTHQGYPSLRMTMSQLNANQVMRMHCIIAGKRLVRVWVIARTEADLDTPAIRAFFDSLRIK